MSLHECKNAYFSTKIDVRVVSKRNLSYLKTDTFKIKLSSILYGQLILYHPLARRFEIRATRLPRTGELFFTHDIKNLPALISPDDEKGVSVQGRGEGARIIIK